MLTAMEARVRSASIQRSIWSSRAFSSGLCKICKQKCFVEYEQDMGAIKELELTRQIVARAAFAFARRHRAATAGTSWCARAASKISTGINVNRFRSRSRCCSRIVVISRTHFRAGRFPSTHVIWHFKNTTLLTRTKLVKFAFTIFF